MVGAWLIAWPWLIARGHPPNARWAYAVASLLATALVAIVVAQRALPGIPGTVRIVLRREGVLQETTAPYPAAYSAIRWMLLLLYFAMVLWGPDTPNGSVRPLVFIFVGVMVLIPYLGHYHPDMRGLVPWSECSEIALQRTSPKRARLMIWRAKTLRRYPVDADLDLDAEQARWLEERMRTIREQAGTSATPG